MDQDAIFIGFFLTALFIGAALWHIRENAKLETALLKKTDEQTTKWLVHFAWSRTLQLLAALGCAIVIFINYDKELIESRENLDKLTEAIEKTNQLEGKSVAEQNKEKMVPHPGNNRKPIKMTAPNPVPLQGEVQPLLAGEQETTLPPAVIIARQQALALEQQASPQIQRKTPIANIPVTNVPDQAVTVIQPSQMRQTGTQPAVLPPNNSAITPSEGAADSQVQNVPNNTNLAIITPAEQTNTPSTPMVRSSKSEAIEALYDPEKSPTDSQSGLDDIKKRYEDIIVIYLFLKKCNKTQPNDLSIINNALTQEVAAARAPDKFQSDIMTAARGSYNEIYARSACDGKGIADLTNQYNNYVTVLSQNYPMEQ